MNSPVPYKQANHVLSMLSPKDFRRIEPVLKEVQLLRDQVLCEPGESISDLYFPMDGLVSLFFDPYEHPRFESAMEGKEAAVGLLSLFAGDKSSHLCRVRQAGTAMCLPVAVLSDSGFGELRSLKSCLRQYSYALSAQIAQLGICNALHTIDSRLARWLLMSDDRLSPKRLDSTQDAIALLLGVRRSSVSQAATVLREREIITYKRGHLEIVDRALLRSASCSCYAGLRC
jgi:CRP-like cAMP-binding protein